MTAIAAIVILCVLYGLAEVYLDRKIRNLLDYVIQWLKVAELHSVADIVRDSFSDIMHKHQTPLRLICAGLISTIGILSGVHIISSILIVTASLWASIDLICNLWWLKQPAFYVGSTAKTDKVLNNPWINWGLKIVLFLGGICIEIFV